MAEYGQQSTCPNVKVKCGSPQHAPQIPIPFPTPIPIPILIPWGSPEAPLGVSWAEPTRNQGWNRKIVESTFSLVDAEAHLGALRVLWAFSGHSLRTLGISEGIPGRPLGLL